ncbi:unnamed protein product [Orchesella dallaii]|uniref:F-box domain-containing protein n=1 Tax=Orchesella dallaii TaxID=48710 RepID=A0ABP1RSX4_9HEXA
MDFWSRANPPGQVIYNTLNEQSITHFTMEGAQSILQKVFHFLSVEDLKVCRLVVKSWHEPATLILAERIQGILLHEKTDWKKFLKILTKACTSTRLSGLAHIHPFHSFIFYGCYPEDPSWTPYKSAILDYMHAKVKLPKKTVWEEKFFTTFGLQILELRYCQFNFLNTERALREFREMLSTSCPNLASLKLEFQKEATNKSTTTPTPTPSPSPSPSPQIPCSGGLSNVSVFFPPTEESLKKSMDNLKKFTFRTDNKCWVNPNALEEFMSFMPALEEFTYRYTGAKKQWAFVRKVDVIDILCNLIQCGNLSKLKVLDLDSKGTVLAGEDFRKLCKLDLKNSSSGSVFDNPHGKIRLTRFSSQVFIKSEQDWEYFCCWLAQFNLSVKEIDIQVRSHFSQLPAEEQLPTIFPKVTTATLLLDNNFQVFLRRMPHVQRFCGVYDNELLPFCSATQSLSLDSGTGHNGSSSSSLDGNNGSNVVFTNFSSNQLEVGGRKGSRKGSLKQLSPAARKRRSQSEDFCGTSSAAAAALPLPPIASTPPSTPITPGHPPPLSPSCCSNVKYLRIYSNDESMLDIEWKAGLFRNISSLETDIYFDQDLRLIWSHLQTLTELILHLKTMIPEQAFTGAGVPPIMFQESGNKHHAKGMCTKYKDSEDYHDEEHMNALNEYPNLSMMEDLRVFEIHTEGRQDAFGSQFSASLIIYGVSLLYQLQRLVLPPAIPSKCLERSVPYMGRLLHLRHLTVCDDTFNNVLPFHVLKSGLPDLEIVVKYYQSDIKRMLCNPWRAERLIFPDFLPEHRSSSLGGAPPLSILSSSSSVRTRFHLSKQCSAP